MQMRCNEIRRRMSAYLDSELDGESTFDVAEHLQGCESCNARFEAERIADSLMVDRLRVGAMPADLRDTIRASIMGTASWRNGSRPASRRFLRGWWMLVAAALMAFLAIGLLRRQDAPLRDAILQSYLELTSEAAAAEWLVAARPPGGEVPLVEGIRLRTQPDAALHVIDFVALKDSADPELPYLEVRLLCCGEPVLLRLIRSDAIDEPAELRQLGVDEASRSTRHGGITVSARRIGEYVAFAVSRHPIDRFLDVALLT